MTVTSDQAADTINLAAASAFITVNGQADALPPTITPTSSSKQAMAPTPQRERAHGRHYFTLTVDGGEEDDFITGGSGFDVLRGDGGNDRIVGFKGTDQLEGGDGNDELVWNNGDGTDVMDGDAGSDEVEINGAPTAGDVFSGVPLDGRVFFSRTNWVPFTVDFSAERLTVNGLGGNDTFTGAAELAPLTLITANGGAGDDMLTGGDGPEVINGGDGTTSSRRAGDDRIIGVPTTPCRGARATTRSSGTTATAPTSSTATPATTT